MNAFVYDHEEGCEPLRIAKLLQLMGTNYARSASYMLPDLQRDYVWGEKKIINLIDTLMKGWPFGQILVAQTGRLSARFSPRAFYSKIVRVGDAPCMAMNADPNSDDATLVLDGQQRLQSLFLALSPCSDGLVLDQRTWIASLNPKNAYYLGWGHPAPAAFLALNVENLAAAYEECEDVSRIDYSSQAKLPILEWVFDHDIRDSQLWNRRNLLPKFLKTSWGEDNTSGYLLLKDMWGVADVSELLEGKGVRPECIEPVKRFFGRFSIIREVPVPVLRVLSREKCGLSVEEYNEMILSVFTRLNAGGVKLSEDEITFSWIKRFWSREDVSAEVAIADLRIALAEEGIDVKGGALVRLLSGIWADIERGGRQLTEADLLDGQLLKSVAAFLASNWETISSQIGNAARLLRQHNLMFGSQYFSLHGFTILASWMIIGRLWANRRGASSCAEQVKFDSLFGAWIGGCVDRLIMACQWASSLGNYDGDLNKLNSTLKNAKGFEDAYLAMADWMTEQIKKHAETAKVSINGLERATRAGVSAYTTQLWCWQRLDVDRMRISEMLAREQGGITAGAPNVDHCVSYSFWEEYVGRFPDSPKGSDVYNSRIAKINQLGNCNVLCKEINCSKSSTTMREFLAKMGFKESDVRPLAIPAEMLSPDADSLTPDVILRRIGERTALIRSGLCKFLDGCPTHRLHPSV